MCKRTHVFWQDPVGEYIDYLRLSRSFSDKVHVISHNSRGYDPQFLLRKILELRWVPKLISHGSKIFSVVENLHFLDSVNYLPVSLKSMPKSFDLSCKKGYYPHFFNAAENVGPHPEPKLYGADFMSGDEGAQFSAWYEGVKGTFLTIGRNCWPIAWRTSMNWGRHAVLGNCFWNWSRWTPFGKPSQYRPFLTRCSKPCF